MNSRTARSIAVALVAVALAFTWQALTVRYNYGGNWTGLFCTGASQRIPRDLLHEEIYALTDSHGFDGQFYHYIAHDPLLRTQLPGYVDSPRLRYRRILVPGLAHIVAAGRPQAIDAGYFAVVLLFVFLGAYWLSRYAVLNRRHPAWGFLFLLLPSTLASVDRMAADIALSALWVGFAVYATEGHDRRLTLVVALAPLARETGFAMIGTYCLWALWGKKPGQALQGAAAALPCLLWYVYLHRAVGPDVNGWVAFGFGGMPDAVLHPFPYPWSAAVNLLVTASDYLAAAGAVTAVALCLRFAAFRREDLLELATAVQGALGLILVVFGSRDLWIHFYGFGRVLSPAVVLLALRSLARRRWSDLTPLALLMPRTALQFGGDAWRILRGIGSAVMG